MAKIDELYRDLLVDIVDNGVNKSDRTGTGTRSLFGRQLRYSMKDGFPILTTKKVHFKSVLGELLWFLDGSTSAKELRDKYGVTIWDEWKREDGSLGPVYGKQWTDWYYMSRSGGPHYKPYVEKRINQIQNAVDMLKNDPDSRRIMVNAWNVGEIDQMALPPCHYGFQLYTNQNALGERVLSLMWNQRSWDLLLGSPYNIASYAILLTMFAQQTDMKLGDLICNAGDCHIYDNHMPYVEKQLERDVNKHKAPTLLIRDKKDIFSYVPDDFALPYYESYPNWKNVPVAV